MALVTKFEPLADWIEISVQGTSREIKQKAIADFAWERLEAARQVNQAALGRVPSNKQFVDGRVGAALESVDPERGTIVFEFDLIADALKWIAELLVARSPIVSGDYIRGHRLFADGQEVNARTTADIPAAEEYVFLNIVPYSRRLEVGKTKSGRAFLVQVPNRIYERTADDAKRRFGNFASVKFSYRSPVLAYGGAPSKHRRASHGKWSGGAEWQTRAPAIVVTPR